jgi:acetyl esterase
MKKAKKEKVLTVKQLKRRINGIRLLMSILSAVSFKKKRKCAGIEKFLPTDKGSVRVLTYNMDNTQRLPLYINIHGGGFVLGNAEIDDPFMPDIADKANVKIISIDYSLAPEFPFPKALDECYAVVKYAKEHPEEFGIDPERIAVGGQSAGGNLSAGICLLDNVKKQLGIKCLILDYPPLDLYTDAGLKPQPKGALPVFMCRVFDAGYCNDREERNNPLISPVYATVDDVRSFPPTLIITAFFDSLCGEGERFRDKLIEAGVEATHRRFNAKHGFNLEPGTDSDESWQMIMTHLKRWLWAGN